MQHFDVIMVLAPEELLLVLLRFHFKIVL